MKVFAIACLIGCICQAASQGLTYPEALALAEKGIAEAVSTATALTASAKLDELRTSVWCPPAICTMEYAPVCAFSLCDGVRTFSNRCALDSYNRCNLPGYVVLFQGTCESYFRCPFRAILPGPVPLPAKPLPVEEILLAEQPYEEPQAAVQGP